MPTPLDVHTRSGIIDCVDLRQIISDEMVRQDLTQTELENRTGVLQHRISDYLNGKTDINAETLRRLLEALSLEIQPRRRRKGRR